MSTGDLVHQALLSELRTALARVRAELQAQMANIDVLDRDRLTEVLELMDQRLIIVQHDFVKQLLHITGTADCGLNELHLSAASFTVLPEVAACVTFGGGTAAVLTYGTVTTTSWWIVTNTSTWAAVVGGVVGLSAGVTTLGAGVALGIAGAVATRKVLKSSRRRKIRRKVLAQFDDESAPTLMAWGEKLLATAKTVK